MAAILIDIIKKSTLTMSNCRWQSWQRQYRQSCRITWQSVWMVDKLNWTFLEQCQTIYCRFVNSRFVDSQFVDTLNTKISYSLLTKPQTLKLNAKPGGALPPRTPLNRLWLAISSWSAKIVNKLGVDLGVDKLRTRLPNNHLAIHTWVELSWPHN